MKKRVTGIGGIFFKAKNSEKLLAWYDKHLHISPLDHSPWGADDESPLFEWRDKDDPERKKYTVFAILSEEKDEINMGDLPFMFNYRVDDLDAVLAELAEEGIPQEGETLSYHFGRFARIRDLEGNLVELWEPAQGF